MTIGGSVSMTRTPVHVSWPAVSSRPDRRLKSWLPTTRSLRPGASRIAVRCVFPRALDSAMSPPFRMVSSGSTAVPRGHDGPAHRVGVPEGPAAVLHDFGVAEVEVGPDPCTARSRSVDQHRPCGRFLEQPVDTAAAPVGWGLLLEESSERVGVSLLEVQVVRSVRREQHLFGVPVSPPCSSSTRRPPRSRRLPCMYR